MSAWAELNGKTAQAARNLSVDSGHLRSSSQRSRPSVFRSSGQPPRYGRLGRYRVHSSLVRFLLATKHAWESHVDTSRSQTVTTRLSLPAANVLPSGLNARPEIVGPSCYELPAYWLPLQHVPENGGNRWLRWRPECSHPVKASYL